MFVLYIKNSLGISVHWFSSQKECEDFLTKTSVINYKILPSSKQKNLYFFGCFEWSESSQDFEINLEKAKNQKMNEIRFKRQFYFDKVDKILFKAMELNDEKNIENSKKLKQNLRDITEINLPNNIDDLMNFVPDLFTEIDLIII